MYYQEHVKNQLNISTYKKYWRLFVSLWASQWLRMPGDGLLSDLFTFYKGGKA